MTHRLLINPFLRCAALWWTMLALLAPALSATPTGRLPTIYAFNASGMTTVNLGEKVGFNWSVGDATEVSLAPDIGVVRGTSIVVTPQVTTTYVLTAKNANGFVSKSKKITVIVPPVVTSFTATPGAIAAGQSARLDWAATGATWYYVTADNSSDPGQFFNTSTTVRPRVTTTYTLTAHNSVGTSVQSLTIPVQAPVAKPTITSFTATPASVVAGGTTVLNWAVNGATSLSLSGGVGAVTGNSVSVQPAASTTYVLSATNAGGTVTRNVHVAVTQPPPHPLPAIASFTATPASIARGMSSTLNWSITGADEIAITANLGANPGVVTGTSVNVTPQASTIYTITATNPTGRVTRTVTVNVTTPEPLPEIGAFTASPASIAPGASSTLHWTVSGAASVRITASTGASPGVVSGNSVSVSPTVNTTYTLTATNSIDGSVARSVTVSVAAPPTTPRIEIRSFTASDDLIQPGEEVTLTWEAVNAQSLWMSANYGSDVGDVRGRTSVVVRPMATTRYALTAYHSTYGNAYASVTVNVGPPPVPVVNSFVASPSTISIGNATTLSWSVDGANEIFLTADRGTSPGVVTGSSLTVSPREDTIYTLRATNTYGATTRQVGVEVTPPTAPVIGAFSATPAFILAGSGLGSTLSWSVSGADTISIAADSGVSPGVVTGNSVAVNPTVSTVYTLTATNSVGVTTRKRTVTFYTPGNSSVAHPRVWLTPSRVSQLAQRAAANEPAWIALRNACDQWATMPVRWPDESPATGYIHGGYQYFDYMRPVVELSLAYQVVKDSDPVRAGRYATKAREILMKLSDPDRHGRESTDSGWSIRAYVPALALGYDWIYSTLSDSDRAQIYTQINDWVEWFDANGLGQARQTGNYPTGNYFAGYYAAKALGALATEGENPKADAMWNHWLNHLHYGKVQPYHAQWLSGGGAPDGWNYGPLETINMLRPVAAALTAKGLDLVGGDRPFTWVNGHARWMTQFTWPDMKSVSDRGFVYPQRNPTAASAAWATQYTGLMRMTNAADTPIAQRYLLDLRALAGRDNAEPWVEFLFFDANAPATDYRTQLSYRTQGDGQVAMRSSWANNAVWATFQSGPYTGAEVSSEQFYDQGALVIQRGDVQFLVNAWGAMFRHTPGTEDGERRMGATPTFRGYTPFDQLYTELFGVAPDGATGGRRLFNTFYSFRNVSHPPIPGYYGQIANGPGVASTTLSRFEEGNRYVLMRGTKLEDMYFARYPINGWERTVVYVRPQLFFVYDRTAMASASVDNWMSWHLAANPTEQPGVVGTHRYDVVDTRAAFGGNLFRGRVTTVLPTNHVVSLTNLFDRDKVYRLNIRAAAAATSTTWLSVFDASASADAAGIVAPLTAADGNVLLGDVEGAIVLAPSGPNTAALFSRTASRIAGHVHFTLPAASTYCVVSDLQPSTGYTVAIAAQGDNTLSVQISPGGTQMTTAQGTLTFDVSATTGQAR